LPFPSSLTHLPNRHLDRSDRRSHRLSRSGETPALALAFAVAFAFAFALAFAFAVACPFVVIPQGSASQSSTGGQSLIGEPKNKSQNRGKN
jgi:hypothetical protein